MNHIIQNVGMNGGIENVGKNGSIEPRSCERFGRNLQLSVCLHRALSSPFTLPVKGSSEP